MNLKSFPEIQIPVPKLDPWNQNLQFWNQELAFLKCSQAGSAIRAQNGTWGQEAGTKQWQCCR